MRLIQYYNWRDGSAPDWTRGGTMRRNGQRFERGDWAAWMLYLPWCFGLGVVCWIALGGTFPDRPTRWPARLRWAYRVARWHLSVFRYSAGFFNLSPRPRRTDTYPRLA